MALALGPAGLSSDHAGPPSCGLPHLQEGPWFGPSSAAFEDAGFGFLKQNQIPGFSVRLL